MAVKLIRMTARKRSSCTRCDDWIEPGERIVWETSDAAPSVGLASHEECPIDVVGEYGDDVAGGLRWD
jgi:hypothetical protein